MTKSTRKKKVTSKVIHPKISDKNSVSVMGPIYQLQESIKEENTKLTKLYDNTIEKLEKKTKQQMQKVAAAKTKLAQQQTKLKTAKAKLMTKKTAANTKAVERANTLFLKLDTVVQALIAELDKLKQQHLEVKQAQKKDQARSKALAAFEKAWKKTPVKKALGKEKVTKKIKKTEKTQEGRGKSGEKKAKSEDKATNQ